MKRFKPLAPACLALLLAACGGGDLSIDLPGGSGRSLHLDFPGGRAVEHRLPFRISGGVPPYSSSIEGCPDWVTLFPDQGILAGAAPAEASGRTFFCTYQVTDTGGIQPPQTASWGLRLAVGSSAAPAALSLPPPVGIALSVGSYHADALPPAWGGVAPHTYSLSCAGGSLPPGMGFVPETRVLAGTPEARFRDSCTYTATDSASPAATVSRAVEIEVAGAELTLPRPGALRLSVGSYHADALPAASGGVGPYDYSLTCAGGSLPPGMGFAPETRVLAGTPDAAFQDSCAYTVTDGANPAASASRAVEIVVAPLDRGTWRFRTRTAEPGGPCALPDPGTRTPLAILPHAHGGEAGQDFYQLLDRPRGPFLEFNSIARRLTYIHPSAVPVLGTPTTYRYAVGSAGVDAANADDVLCLDVRFDPGTDACPADSPAEAGRFIHITLRVRDDAYWDGTEYRCPDTAAPAPRAAAQRVSNPVHTALGPVHARRAADAAHDAVRDSVRRWTPGSRRPLAAIAPRLSAGSLSGKSAGFDYDGSSETVSVGAELGAGAWQAGAVAALTRTELDYRAAASLSGQGYRAGEHDTEMVSLHPFAAWHLASGARLWGSVGAGAGELRHRDDPGFPSRSRSDVRLFTHAVGASAPLADLLSGELRAEAGVDGFALEIEGGGQVSSSLPTLRGHGLRAGLAWRAPGPGAPSLSLGYRQLGGDGPVGGRLEAGGSVSAAGVLDPRLTLSGSGAASFGLGGHEERSWRLGGGLRFAPGGAAPELDAGVTSRAADASGAGLGGEAGLRLPGGRFPGGMRPHVGLMRSGHGSIRRVLGLDVLDTARSRLKVELYDRPRERVGGLNVTLEHRF